MDQRLVFNFPRLRELRRSYGPSQEHVAGSIGVSVRTYQRWEAGTASPQYRHVLVLAAYFAVEPAWFYGVGAGDRAA